MRRQELQEGLEGFEDRNCGFALIFVKSGDSFAEQCHKETMGDARIDGSKDFGGAAAMVTDAVESLNSRGLDLIADAFIDNKQRGDVTDEVRIGEQFCALHGILVVGVTVDGNCQESEGYELGTELAGIRDECLG